jgi:hypothetical protein
MTATPLLRGFASSIPYTFSASNSFSLVAQNHPRFATNTALTLQCNWSPAVDGQIRGELWDCICTGPAVPVPQRREMPWNSVEIEDLRTQALRVRVRTTRALRTCAAFPTLPAWRTSQAPCGADYKFAGDFQGRENHLLSRHTDEEAIHATDIR